MLSFQSGTIVPLAPVIALEVGTIVSEVGTIVFLAPAIALQIETIALQTEMIPLESFALLAYRRLYVL